MSRAAESQREAAALEAAAAAAERDAGELEAAAMVRGEDIDLADVHERQEKARGLRWRAKAAAKRADREAAAERLAALAQLRAEVEEYAAGASNQPLGECLAVIRGAAERFAALAAEHNATVARFAEAASALAVAALPPSGSPRESDGGVGLGAGTVVAGGVVLRQYPALEGVPVLVASGEPASLPEPVSARSDQPRPDHVIFSRGGACMTFSGPLRAGHRQQIADGALVELTAEQVDRYMAGREVFAPGELERTRADQMAAAAAEAAAGRQAAIDARTAAELSLAGQWSSPRRQAAHSGRGNP